MTHRPRLFINMGDVEGQRISRHERAAKIEKIVREKYLNDDCDAADIALGVLEQETFWTDEQVARHVAALISQA